MAEITVLLVQPDAGQRARTLAALSEACSPDRIHAVGGVAEAAPLLLQLPGAIDPPLARLVLLDVPPEAAASLLDKLRTQPRTSSLPVIAIADPADRRAQDAWYRTGASSVVGRTPDDAQWRKKLRLLFGYWTTVNVTNRVSRV